MSAAVAGVCLPRVCLPGGGHAQGGVCLGAVSAQVHPGIHTTPLPLWTEFLTHACENITFP